MQKCKAPTVLVQKERLIVVVLVQVYKLSQSLYIAHTDIFRTVTFTICSTITMIGFKCCYIYQLLHWRM